MFEPVKIGVVGLGRFGTLHAQTLAHLAEAELVGLVDAQADRLRQAAAAFPGVAQWNLLTDALQQSPAEAWIVASSTPTHIPVASEILAASKTVLLEKPLAESLAEAQRLRDLVRDDSANLMLGHILLFNSEFRALAKLTSQRGPIRHLDAVRHRSARSVEQYPGESPLYLTMTHDLYSTLALIGDDDPEHLACTKSHDSAGRVNLVAATLKWRHGAVASLRASFLWPPEMEFEGFDRMEVFGDGWSARMEPNPRPLTVWDRTAWHPLGLEIIADAGPPAGMLAEELRAFCRVVRQAEPVPRGARYGDGLTLLRWQEALARSCDSGHRG